MKFIIAGGSGMIGGQLTKVLLDDEHKVVVLSRNPDRAKNAVPDKTVCRSWNGLDTSHWESDIEDTDIIINLVGEHIGKGRWTKKIKQEILKSRVDAGHAISTAVHNSKTKPTLCIQISGTNYYGDENNSELTESSPKGKGFLADVCMEWENSSKAVEAEGVKRAVIRMGPVLSIEGGALKKMLLPFKLFVGGPPGNGKQMFPWIHIDDAVRAIQFIAENRLDGIFNLVSPIPVTMKQFARELGKALHRPGFMPIPAFVLNLIYGEMARETVLAGQNAIPKALVEKGFKFQYTKLLSALKSLI
jgi:uncharacterized protein (TIGR01777 family)